MSDIDVQCCRCRHLHKESERNDVPHKTLRAATQSVCPRCKCTTYYDMTPWSAWCWRSGLIEFGPQMPPDDEDGGGAIRIARGPRSSLEGVLEVVAREGRGASQGKLLVPGVPEAPDQKAAADALASWLKWCAKSNGHRGRNGVIFTEPKEGGAS